MSAQIRVDGLSELEGYLQQLPSKLDDALESALLRAALLVQAAAQAITPVKTGNLRRSEASTTERDGSNIMGIVGTNVIYAIYVHDGTRKMKARPFFTEALDSNQADVQAIIADAVQQAVQGELRR